MKRSVLAVLIRLSVSTMSASAATPVLTSGHADFIGIGYEGGEFEPHSHVEGGVVDGTVRPDEEFEPGDLIVQVYATTIRPASSAWDPTGVPSGQSINLLYETDIAGKPFVGIGAEELDPTAWTGVTVTLTEMVGPAGGQFSLWQTDSGVPTFFISTLGGISIADAYTFDDLEEDDHAHFGWGFTVEGTYELTFKISGTHSVDGFKESLPATYTFNVIPEPSAALLGAMGALALLRRRNCPPRK